MRRSFYSLRNEKNNFQHFIFVEFAESEDMSMEIYHERKTTSKSFEKKTKKSVKFEKIYFYAMKWVKVWIKKFSNENFQYFPNLAIFTRFTSFMVLIDRITFLLLPLIFRLLCNTRERYVKKLTLKSIWLALMRKILVLS